MITADILLVLWLFLLLYAGFFQYRLLRLVFNLSRAFRMLMLMFIEFLFSLPGGFSGARCISHELYFIYKHI